MGPHMGGGGDQLAPTWARLNGVFWAAFLLFSWTAASIVSGALIERIRSGAFWIMGVGIGSVWWILDAAWGWHPEGWMVRLLGYHDAYASGVIHAIAGGFALGALLVLGPRIGKFSADGTPRNLNPRNPWLVTIGLFLIYTGFVGIQKAGDPAVIEFLRGRAKGAFAIVDKHLAGRAFIAGERPTIADLSMVGYLYYPEETGIDRSATPNIEAWTRRIAALPGWKHPYDLMPRARAG